MPFDTLTIKPLPFYKNYVCKKLKSDYNYQKISETEDNLISYDKFLFNFNLLDNKEFNFEVIDVPNFIQ